MTVLVFLLLLAALVLFILAAAGTPSKIGLVPAGLACWVAVDLIIRFWPK